MPQFPVEVLRRFLGHIYFIETAVISPFDYGWGIQRRRRWTVCRHRYKTKHFLSPLNVFSALFNMPCWFGEWDRYKESIPAWDLFFCGKESDIFSEWMWASNRPGSCSHSNSTPGDEEARASDFLEALTSTEREHLASYISASVVDQYQVFSLNQNPAHVDTRSCWRNLQTLIKNAGVMWYLDSEYLEVFSY